MALWSRRLEHGSRRLTAGGWSWGLVLLPAALLSAVPAAVAQQPRTTSTAKPATLYQRNRSFKIPFNVDPAEREKLAEVQLYVSDDSGFAWKTMSRTTPDRPAFVFRAPRDAEYWFAVRTLDARGKVYPTDDATVEPSLKVIVDTTPPSVILEAEDRRGSFAAIRWEVRDEYLDIATLTLEYQIDGAGEWRRVPIRRAALIGAERWDAGTAMPLKVRLSVLDKAGNEGANVITIPGGEARNPATAPPGDAYEFSSPAAIAPISSPSDRAPRPATQRNPLPRETAGSAPPAERGRPPASLPRGSAAAGAASETAGTRTLYSRSPRFAMQYAVEDAGPHGPASVELWVTQDGGRTWIRRGEDPDKVSPFDVDLGGTGTYGLRLVTKSLSGLGDQPPVPGDPPDLWVEVDDTPPNVLLDPPFVGTGTHTGQLAITWRATDVHLGPRPVSISWRADTPNAPWQPVVEGLENNGKYIWTVPPALPPRFHVRVEVVDQLGNRTARDTSEIGGAVIVDRSRPRSRILGLEPAPSAVATPGDRPVK